MKNQTVHWLAQNYKNLFSGGIVLSTVSIGGMLMTAYGMHQRLFPYSYSPKLYLSCMTVLTFGLIYIIIMTIYNYRYLIKAKKSNPQPRKQTFLLIWESICLCVNIFLFVFSLM